MAAKKKKPGSFFPSSFQTHTSLWPLRGSPCTLNRKKNNSLSPLWSLGKQEKKKRIKVQLSLQPINRNNDSSPSSPGILSIRCRGSVSLCVVYMICVCVNRAHRCRHLGVTDPHSWFPSSSGSLATNLLLLHKISSDSSFSASSKALFLCCLLRSS